MVNVFYFKTGIPSAVLTLAFQTGVQVCVCAMCTQASVYVYTEEARALRRQTSRVLSPAALALAGLSLRLLAAVTASLVITAKCNLFSYHISSFQFPVLKILKRKYQR